MGSSHSTGILTFCFPFHELRSLCSTVRINTGFCFTRPLSQHLSPAANKLRNKKTEGELKDKMALQPDAAQRSVLHLPLLCLFLITSITELRGYVAYCSLDLEHVIHISTPSGGNSRMRALRPTRNLKHPTFNSCTGNNSPGERLKPANI